MKYHGRAFILSSDLLAEIKGFLLKLSGVKIPHEKICKGLGGVII